VPAKIAVIGKSGQLAWELSQLESEHQLLFFGRDDIDITNPDSIAQKLEQYDLDGIINASAYTAVDKAESDKESAHLINAQAVKILAEYCKSKQLHFTHISTDYVFDGDKGSPYLPSDDYNPKSVYGVSKMEGEKYIRSIYPENSCIIRTSWVYSSHGNNFVKTMLRLMNEKAELNVIDDQVGSPTQAKGLAQSALYCFENKVLGIQHWTDSGVCSWYDFAKEIHKQGLALGLIKKPIAINPIPTTEYPTPAKRPYYSVLSMVATRDDIQVPNLHWAEALNLTLNQLNN